MQKLLDTQFRTLNHIPPSRNLANRAKPQHKTAAAMGTKHVERARAFRNTNLPYRPATLTAKLITLLGGAAALLGLAVIGSGAALAQDWPAKPVWIVTGFAAGGIGDRALQFPDDSVDEALGGVRDSEA